MINCAGLYADRVAAMIEERVDVRIVPFRGEYYTIKPESHHLVSGLIYPVPDPRFPFLGVHYTRNIWGSVEAGPNAVLAFSREGYRKRDFRLGETMGTLSWPGFWKMSSKHWRTGLSETRRSYSKGVFLRDLQRLLPEITEADLAPGGSGVRAQAVDRNGGLLDDFSIIRGHEAVHVLNAPSPRRHILPRHRRAHRCPGRRGVRPAGKGNLAAHGRPQGAPLPDSRRGFRNPAPNSPYFT